MQNRPFPISSLHAGLFPGKYNLCRNTYDIIHILSGTYRITYLNMENIYTGGDICLIPPQIPYTIESCETGNLIHMSINPQFVIENLSASYSLLCDSVREPDMDYSALCELVADISAKYMDDTVKNRLAIQGLCFRLLAMLEESYLSESFPDTVPEKYRERIRKIINFIDSHYSEPITLSELAESLYLTPQYVSRFLKQCLGISFRELLSGQRLTHAYREICFSERDITDIALHYGFSNTAAFSRAFRNRYGISPSHCRQKARNEQNKPVRTISSKTTADYGSLSVQPNSFYTQRIRISVQNGPKWPSDICSLLNIGMIHSLLQKDFQKSLSHAKHDLGIRYVRIQGLMSTSFTPKVLPDYHYYFQNLHTALIFLYKNGLIPVFELSKRTSDSGEEHFYVKNERFFEMLEQTLQYCRNFFPEEWTSKWKFELWMAPHETPESYVENFKKIRALITEFLPGAQTGGFGIPAGIKKEQLDTVFRTMILCQFQPDFLSAHFTLETGSHKGRPLVSSSPDYMLNETKKLSEAAHIYYPDVPLYLTEWTSSYYFLIPVQYSCFQAAFICRTVLSLYPYYSLMGYWILAENVSPSVRQVSLSSFWTQGLLGRNQLKTPAYYAFSIVNLLSGSKIDQHSNSIAVQKEPGHYQILAFRYSHFTSGTVFLPEQPVSFPLVYQLFEQSTPKKTEFTLTDIQSGVYQITRTLLNQENGSVLDIWIQGFLAGNITETEYLMKLLLPTPDQRSYLEKYCIPRREITYIQTDDSLTISAELRTHTVCMWDIQLLY